MNELNNMAAALTPAIEKLAEVMNVSVDYLMANFQPMLLEYGQYALMQKMIVSFWVTITLCLGASMFVLWMALEIGFEDKTYVKLCKWAAVISFVLVAIVVLTTACTYWASPLMYSIEAVMKLIK